MDSRQSTERCLISLECQDLERSARFYGQLLDVSFHAIDQEIRRAHVSGAYIELRQSVRVDRDPVCEYEVFVPDPDKALQRLRELHGMSVQNDGMVEDPDKRRLKLVRLHHST